MIGEKPQFFLAPFLANRSGGILMIGHFFYSPRLVYLQRNQGPASRSLACSHELNKSRERFLTITLLLILLASGAHKRRKLFSVVKSFVLAPLSRLLKEKKKLLLPVRMLSASIFDSSLGHKRKWSNPNMDKYLRKSESSSRPCWSC